MRTLTIKDLSLTEELSPEQLEKINGGMAAEYEETQEKATQESMVAKYLRSWFYWQ